MKKTFYYSITLFFLAFPAFAGNWKIDQAASKIEFSGNHGEKKFAGNFKKIDGEIKFDPNNLATSFAKIKIDLSFAQTGDPTYDKTLPQADWLDIKTNQFAYYETSKISKIKDNDYQIDGFLIIKGIKIPQNFKAIILINNDKANLKASTTINRLSFNIGKNSDAKGDWVSLKIPLKIEVNAIAVK